MSVAGFASAAYGATSIAPSVAPLFEAWGLTPAVAMTLATVGVIWRRGRELMGLRL